MDLAPAQLVSLKVIAARLGVGVKKLNKLLKRGADDNPLPVDYDPLLELVVSDEARIAAWLAAERGRRLPYQQAVKEGRIRARKAS